MYTYSQKDSFQEINTLLPSKSKNPPPQIYSYKKSTEIILALLQIYNFQDLLHYGDLVYRRFLSGENQGARPSSR